MAILALLAGLLLSGTAAYYSIIGLIAIFPGAIFAISLMGVSLEFAKLVAASWLYRNWSIAPKIIKAYFVFAISILIFITSLGTFGYLSKVHIESSAVVADKSIEIATIEQQIANETRLLNNAQRAIDNLEDASSQSLFNAAQIRADQKQERTELNEQIQQSSIRINELNAQLLPLKIANAQIEAKVGPLKYIAELIYGKEKAKDYFDSAVRFVIILIVLVFDPLAVLLLIAANISFMPTNKNYDIIDKNQKRVDKKMQKKYNKETKGGIYNFTMRDDFGIQHTDKVNDNESTREIKEK